MRILWDELCNFRTVPSCSLSASRFCNVSNTIQKFWVMIESCGSCKGWMRSLLLSIGPIPDLVKGALPSITNVFSMVVHRKDTFMTPRLQKHLFLPSKLHLTATKTKRNQTCPVPPNQEMQGNALVVVALPLIILQIPVF